MDSAQAVARDGRHRRNRVHARQIAHDEDERRVLRVDERQPLIAPASPRGIQSRIVSVAHHDSRVRLISLTLPVPFPFHAGQYLNVVHPGGVRIPMSIASAPERIPELELHYRPLPGVAEAALMNELLDSGTELSIEGP